MTRFPSTGGAATALSGGLNFVLLFVFFPRPTAAAASLLLADKPAVVEKRENSLKGR